MFTGLIEAVGEVLTFEQVPGGARLVLATALGAEFSIGESVAVNGVCLTVVEHNDHAAAFDLGPETERVTALGTLAPGVAVNLERAVRADARLGGHFVLGHVDGVGTIIDVRPEADFTGSLSATRGSWRQDSCLRDRWRSMASASRRGPHRRTVRRADRAAHGDAYDDAPVAPRHGREPRMRRDRQVRRARGSPWPGRTRWCNSHEETCALAARSRVRR